MSVGATRYAGARARAISFSIQPVEVGQVVQSWEAPESDDHAAAVVAAIAHTRSFIMMTSHGCCTVDPFYEGM